MSDKIWPIVMQIVSHCIKNYSAMEMNKVSHERDRRDGGREGGKEREREGGGGEREREAKSTHSVSESDSPTTDRFLCGRGGVFGYCSLINTDRDLFFCSRLFGLFFGGLLRVYGGLSMLCWERPSSIATLLTGEPSCF